MNKDNQIKHHIYWIAKMAGFIKDQDAREIYKKFMQQELSQDVCNEIDALVSHIKINY